MGSGEGCTVEGVNDVCSTVGVPAGAYEEGNAVQPEVSDTETVDEGLLLCSAVVQGVMMGIEQPHCAAQSSRESIKGIVRLKKASMVCLEKALIMSGILQFHA